MQTGLTHGKHTCISVNHKKFPHFFSEGNLFRSGIMEKKSNSKYLISIIHFIYELVRWTIILVALALIILYLCGIRPYIVKSGSMEPAVMTGSICFVNNHAKYADVKTGDIITFRIGTDSMATHRAIAVLPNGIKTKGDNNETEDAALVTEDIFVGKTIFFIPKIGYIITKLRTRNGIIMIVVFILFLILLGKLLEPAEENSENTNY